MLGAEGFFGGEVVAPETRGILTQRKPKSDSRTERVCHRSANMRDSRIADEVVGTNFFLNDRLSVLAYAGALGQTITLRNSKGAIFRFPGEPARANVLA